MKTQLKNNTALNKLTTFNMGGEPKYYARPENYDQLFDALSICKSSNLPVKVLGGGSNLVVDDYELDFAVIHIRKPAFDWIRNGQDNTISVGGGVPLRNLLRFCVHHGNGGAEFLAGIPGTIGGAVVGNAGAWGSAVDEIVRSVTIVDENAEKHTLKREDIVFSYRHSSLNNTIVTEAKLELPPRTPELVDELIKQNLKRKRNVQPTSKPNAGCIFKNPGNMSAGKLLDSCGFRGFQIGGAKVSDVHANFICNYNSASATDVFRIIEKMKITVFKRFGIDLELEVKLWRNENENDNAKVA